MQFSKKLVALAIAIGAAFASGPTDASAVLVENNGSGYPPAVTTVALTFDDGPDPTWTPHVLDVLARHGVRATFFMLGQEVAAHPDLARRVAAEGHVVANHTWSHPHLTGLRPDQFSAEIDRTTTLLESVTGIPVTCVRPPGGAIDAGVRDQLASRGLAPVGWNVDSRDWSRPGAGAVTNLVLAGLQPGAVILMHDGGGDRSQTVTALTAILDAIDRRDLQIAPVCDGSAGVGPHSSLIITSGGTLPSFPTTVASNVPLVAFASTPTGRGHWQAGADGGVFALGDAMFFGSTGGLILNQPIVGMATTPHGDGYWLVARDGGVFAFGAAQFWGSMGGRALNEPIAGMGTTETGNGYWLVARDGGVFAFGDAPWVGSLGGTSLVRPVVAMATAAPGDGYWLVASDGGVFAFGSAQFAGASLTGSAPVVAASGQGQDGYWILRRDGSVEAFGSASSFASPALAVREWAAGIVSTPGSPGYSILAQRPT